MIRGTYTTGRTVCLYRATSSAATRFTMINACDRVGPNRAVYLVADLGKKGTYKYVLAEKGTAGKTYKLTALTHSNVFTVKTT